MKLWDRFRYDLISPGNAREAARKLKNHSCEACRNTVGARFFSCDYEKLENSERELRRDWWFQGYAICKNCGVSYTSEAENDPTELSKGYYWARTKADWTLEKVHETYQTHILEEINNLTIFYQVRQKLDQRQPKVTFKILKYNEL